MLDRLTARARTLAGASLVATSLILGSLGAAPVAAAGSLSITPITWNVIGIDSNLSDRTINDGPNVFPVGARICNTSGGSLSGITANFVWDGAGTVSLSLQGGISSITIGTLANGACEDAYFNVVIPRAAASRQTSRPYHIEARVSGSSVARTPANRELYVEGLVSQNRNTTLAISGAGGCNPAPTNCAAAPTQLVIGQTYTFKLYGRTSTAYDQLESFITFPSIVRVVSSSSTFSTGTLTSSTSIYADGCGWVNDTTSGSYRSCSGTGDAGGDVVVTYTVTPVSVGSGSLSAVFYDFSGSSYHYNSDYGSLPLAITVVTAQPTPTPTPSPTPSGATPTPAPTASPTLPPTDGRTLDRRDGGVLPLAGTLLAVSTLIGLATLTARRRGRSLR